jgi:hypothetical protein
MAAPPMSVMNWRRLTPNMESPVPQSVYRTLNLPQKGRQVLGADLNNPLLCQVAHSSGGGLTSG